MFYEQKFLLSLLLTLVVEISTILVLLRFFYKEKLIKTSKVILAGFIASTLTLPYFCFILPFFVSDRGLYIILGESLIILIEMFLYNQLLKLNFKKAFVISFMANILSILIGLLM